ncbi:uncharacterized protein B0P05DRAFT_556203 [Gilbertella persicaria]|uniref:uncharacterized protein n=1 Tax=Gilbertella persicaria TaxID=101096 RepID=UPI00222102B7|nr:uncharacterized protein B0P05DRAFT_556203 [Gilbertella persicaria]KAI8062809.1 hypothetical protein B0P05DRAFT_556203 [Gilbertella persicaria]
MSLSKISDKDCWFVIGAHQAGASERQCAELSGLSRRVIHNIITNFRKLGSPHANQLSLDNLIDSACESVPSEKNPKVTKTAPRKRGRPPKPKEAPFFTENIVRKALTEARKYQIVNNTASAFPLDRLNTPPTDEDSLTLDPLKVRRSSREDDILPATPRSITLDDSDDEEWSLEEDKELLMHVLGSNVKNVKWKELEGQFGDRHLAKMCSERWEFIKEQLLKDITSLKG